MHGPPRPNPNRLAAVLSIGVEANKNTPHAQIAEDQQPQDAIPPPEYINELPDDLRGNILKWATDPYRDCKAIGGMCSLSKAFSEWCRNWRGEDFWHWVCKLLEWDRDDRLWTVWTWDASAKHWNTSVTQPWRKQYQAWCNRQLNDVTIREALSDIQAPHRGGFIETWHIDDPVHKFYGHIGCWDTSKVTDMGSLFFAAATFNHDISPWNTSRVTNMNSMFYEANMFNQDISQWDTSKVTDMGLLFFDASVFNQNISQWDTSRVTNMRLMFHKAYAFDQNISRWDTSRVKSFCGMFSDAILMQSAKKPRMTPCAR